MNGAKINPETLKGMETEDKINGLIDMVYNIQCQPKLCQSQFVGKKTPLGYGRFNYWHSNRCRGFGNKGRFKVY